MVDYLKDEDRILYNSDEKNAYRFVTDHVRIEEPCCLAGHADRGKTAMFRGLINTIKRDFPTIKILSYLITKETSQNDVLDEITSSTEQSKTWVIAHIASDTDASRILKALRKLRDTHGSNFLFIVLADLVPIYKPYLEHNKQLLRSLYVCKPLELNDSMGVLHSFEVRFSHTIDQNVKERIFDLSGGGRGLLSPYSY
jgi:hypothetical protein